MSMKNAPRPKLKPSDLNKEERQGLLARILRPFLAKESIEFEPDVEDCFDHRSGHTTRPTGTYTVVILGVDGEAVERLKHYLGNHCLYCAGIGKVNSEVPVDVGGQVMRWDKCPRCKGKGTL